MWVRVAWLTLWCAACWQPPDLPVPVYEQPSDAELLAQRPYTLFPPDGGDLSRDGGWPLLVILHGYGSTGIETRSYLQLDAEDAQARAFLVMPHGLRAQGAAPQRWYPDLPPQPPWDSAYVRALLLDVLAKAPIDRSRVYVVGFSQGAHMAHRVACDSADLVTGVVGIAGQLEECAPVKPVSVLTIHGTADRAIAYYGVPSAPATSTTWARADGCTGAFEALPEPLDLTTRDGGETTIQTWRGCPPGIDVQLWTMHEVGHLPSWLPGLSERLLGFLDAHPRP